MATQLKRAHGRPSASFPRLAQRFLPECWPTSDRDAWMRACKPARALSAPGPAAHLRSITQQKHAKEWGYFLRFLEIEGLLNDDEKIGDRLTVPRLGDYIDAITAGCRASTVRRRVMQLSYAVAAMVPDRDWTWVRRHPALPTEREAAASSKERAHCDPAALVAGARELCRAAEGLKDPLLAAVRYRDGVLLAFAFWSVLRRKNLAELVIGKTIIITPDYARVIFQPGMVKNDQVLEMQVPAWLLPDLRHYIDKHRPSLLRGGADGGELWINREGQPLSYNALYGLFQKHGLAMVQKKIHPHSTRYSMATAVLSDNPLDIDLAAACLGHRNENTTERFYNQAGPMAANQAWRRVFTRRAAEED